VIVDAANVRRTVFAKIFVLAVGGIETPRLLLATDVMTNGLGNRSGKLGRYYACHFGNLCARLVCDAAKPAFGFEKTTDGVYCRRKLLFTPEAQRQHRLLNTAFRLHFPDYSDAAHGSAVMSVIYLAKSTLIPKYRKPASRLAHARNVVAGFPQMVKFGWQWLFLRQLAERKLPYTLVPTADGSFPLEFNCEQTPMESSRITLNSDRDRHGLQRVHVAWRVAEHDIAAAFRGFQLLRSAINSTESCRLEFDEGQLATQLSRSTPVGAHHLGTARMAQSPGEGVVNTQCAVFDIPNLYIAGSAVFPTSSHANPTLTIVALALRLGEHLKEKLSGTSVG
jgi:choline dehydrogenase-like flavoprotein